MAVSSARRITGCYDDGNMTYDGRFGHIWTAENRMRSSETVAAAYHAGAPRQQLYYEEDYVGRRIGKTVYEWYSHSNAFCLKVRFTFAFSGWNVIYEQRVERDSPANAWTTNVISYTWGLDASGSFQGGAGGVGGLISMTVRDGLYAGDIFLQLRWAPQSGGVATKPAGVTSGIWRWSCGAGVNTVASNLSVTPSTF